MNDRASHNHCTHKFIDLANELKEQGYEAQLVSGALMSASGIYATYVSAGNEGARRLYERRGMTVESGWPRLLFIPRLVVRMTKLV